MLSNSGLDGLRKLHESYPDLVIMSKELPMIDEEDACLRIRQASYSPIIVLGNEEESAETLELGADAYLMKPPGLIELVARVNSLLRRKPRYYPENETSTLEIENNEAEKGNGAKLTETEFRLASCLVCNKGRLLEYSQLISEVWGGKEVSRGTLHFHMRRLQQKLQVLFPYQVNIHNFRGVGYCLSRDSSAPE